MALGTIIGTTPTWWEIQNVPDEMIEELRRRSNSYNIGQSYPKNVVFDFEKERVNYKGPMTPWIRIFSNSTGQPLNTIVPPSEYLQPGGNNVTIGYDGFILKGGDGFFDAFGYDTTTGLLNKNAIIGYQANGQPHFLKSAKTQKNYNVSFDKTYPQRTDVSRVLPPPGIISANVRQSKEYLTYGSFKFKCYSLAQLEYLSPFFLNPGINVFIEFGWNLYNQQSLINLSEPKDCWNLVYRPQSALDKAMLSYGNYGCISGIISKYNYTTNDGFMYECNVDLTSRQGLYAGMRLDDGISVNTTDGDSNTYVNLKTFFKVYLPSINDVIRQNPDDTKLSNYYNYIANNSDIIQSKYNEKNKEKKDSDANANQLRGNVVDNLPTLNKEQFTFYQGKAEDRVFTGRRYDVYHKSKSPEEIVEITEVEKVYTQGSDYKIRETIQTVSKKIKPSTIEYVSAKGKKQLSFFDSNDFDANDNNDEVWIQLDFVFELFNLLMSSNEKYKLDISDIVVNAHPNLMSLNKDLLIPNPVSPKINQGRFAGQGKDTGTQNDKGYLRGAAAELATNKYLNLSSDITLNGKDVSKSQDKLTNGNISFDFNDGLNVAARLIRNKFKTAFYSRDNIDTIINYLYYNSANSNPDGSAAFPFVKETWVYDSDGTLLSEKPYKPYYYGYLKHLYISKTKLISIVTDENIKNYKELLKSLLNFINNSVDNFWKFEVVERQDGKGLSIVDKNGVGNLDKIYTFDVGSTENVIRSITFDVNLSNEQSVNVLFGGTPIENKTSTYKDQISKINTPEKYQAIYSKLNNEPNYLKFNDRMDQYELGLFLQQMSGSINETVQPGTPRDLKDENNEIALLQTYGKKEDILTIQVKYGEGNVVKNSNPYVETFLEESIIYSAYKAVTGDKNNSSRPTVEPTLNIKYLNWNESCRGLLRSVLTDGDIYNNVKYSGIADNFQVTIMFDGIFGFRNLQCFAISNMPKPYIPGVAIFQVLEVEHEVNSGKWITTVTALVRSVGGKRYDYVKV